MSSDHSDSNELGAAPHTPELRLRALELLLTENSHVEPAALGTLIKAFESRIDPHASADIAGAEPDRPAAQVGAQAMLAIPRDADGPIFRDRWEALAFALALALAERGSFTWGEWAEAFGGEIVRARKAGELGQDATYYRCWLAALEHMVAYKGLADRASSAR
jgi:nitrile hydratase accessory protein